MPPTERYPRLLVCEGDADKLFFGRFIAQRGLPRFHIRSAKSKDKIGQAIQAYKIEAKSNFPNIRDVLVVADNDDNPDDRFSRVCDQIRYALGSRAVPSAPRQTVQSSPRCTVLMIPSDNEHGALESILKEPTRCNDSLIAGHVDTFLDLVHAERWQSQTRWDKAWLRSNLAVRHKKPFIELMDVFKEEEDRRPISFNHQSLDWLGQFLSQF